MNITRFANKLTKVSPIGPLDLKETIGTVGRGGITMATVLGSALSANPDFAERWYQSSVQPAKKNVAGLYVSSDWSASLEDAKGILSMCAGIPRTLDVKWLLLSLNEHKGGALGKKQFDAFKNAMMPFSCLKFVDCHVAYRSLNKVIRATICIEKGFRVSLTYFPDEIDNELAFSLDYDKENIISGHGNPADIASAIADIVKSV